MDANARDEIIQACVKHAEQSLGTTILRTDIVRMSVRSHKYKSSVDIEVEGDFPEKISDSPGEKVVAILESKIGARFLVITPNRGAIRGIPYLFGEQDVIPNTIRYQQ